MVKVTVLGASRDTPEALPSTTKTAPSLLQAADLECSLAGIAGQRRVGSTGIEDEDGSRTAGQHLLLAVAIEISSGQRFSRSSLPGPPCFASFGCPEPQHAAISIAAAGRPHEDRWHRSPVGSSHRKRGAQAVARGALRDQDAHVVELSTHGQGATEVPDPAALQS